MNLVINFKNQIGFRQNFTIDLKMLKISIKQWNRLYEPKIDKTFIVGSYTDKEIEDIITYLSKQFIDKFNIKILNAGSIPVQFNTNKISRVNYQMIKAWEYIKEPFILGTNDIFPIKKIDNKYLNKEYKVKYKDYTNIKELSLKEPNKVHWLTHQWIYAIDYFRNKYNFDSKTIYELHNAYVVNKEFMDFYLSDSNLWIQIGRDIVIALWLKMNGKEILSDEEFCKVTFDSNKLQINKNDLKKLKMLNVTLPNHPDSVKLLKKVLLK